MIGPSNVKAKETFLFANKQTPENTCRNFTKGMRYLSAKSPPMAAPISGVGGGIGINPLPVKIIMSPLAPKTVKMMPSKYRAPIVTF